MLLLLTCCSQMPFGRWNEEIPARLRDLVIRCWDADYDKRPNFDEVCDILEEESKMLGSKMTKGPPTNNAEAHGNSGGKCCSVM